MGGGGGGGGGDGGYAASQAAQESRKQAARDAVNRIFGVGSSSPARREPIYGTPTVTEGVDTVGNITYTMGDAPITGYRDVPAGDASEAMKARQAGYDRVRSATFDLNKQKLDQDRTDASRMLRFALLRSGNSGGGLDIDQNNLLQRKMDQGIIDVTNMADAAALNARTSDEKARLDLLSRIDAGMDQGSAVQGAQSQLQTSADNALAQAKGSIIGNAFADAGLMYQGMNQDAGYAEGMNNYMLRRRGGAGGVSAPSFSGTVNRT